VANRLAISTAIADRIRETVPPQRIEVITDDNAVTVSTRAGSGHSGGVLHLTASLWMLRAPLPMRLRLRLLFENHAASVQEFLSRALGSPWSSPAIKAHVRVTDDQINVWFGGNDPRDAEVTWRPFDRNELGL
jgi:hypothetical protein